MEGWHVSFIQLYKKLKISLYRLWITINAIMSMNHRIRRNSDQVILQATGQIESLFNPFIDHWFQKNKTEI